MKTLLLTGAYGLVGSNICKVLERDYPDIQITKAKCDVRKEMYHGIYEFDYIIHAAGYGQPQMFGKDKIETIRINTDHLHFLFDLLKEDGKFLFVSSSEVYSGAPSPHKETDIGTTTPQHTRACYIEGKRCGEAICMAYREQGYDVKIARLALAYGPGTKKGDTRVLNQFIEQALTTGEIKMKDGGISKRNYLYIDDCVHMLLNILFDGKDTVYNVGGDSKTTIGNLALMIAKQTGVKAIAGYESNSSAPQSVDLDIDKIMEEFPMELIDLQEGLKRTIEYQKELYAG